MFKRRNRFLDVNLRPTNKQLETDLQIKPTDAHQFLHTTSRYPHHCKKRIPYSQVLRYNQICSDNEKFDQCCHDLEKWLMERGYSERRDGILEKRRESRHSFLERGNSRTSESKLTFNISYYPAFQNVRSLLQELKTLRTT